MVNDHRPAWADYSPEEEQEAEDFIKGSEPGCVGTGIFLIIALAAMFWIGLWFFVKPAFAHDAMPTAAQPDGWTYPLSCCSGYDCREVPKEAVEEGPDGYVIKATGEVIPYGNRKVRVSPDGKFHWCSVQGKPDSNTICLFAPFGGS